MDNFLGRGMGSIRKDSAISFIRRKYAIIFPMATNMKKPSVKPLGDRVVVLPMPKEDATPSGILLPDSANREAPSKGTVVAVGAGRYDAGKIVPMAVSVGDTVLFSKYGYDEVKVDGQEYYILSESSVLAILK